MRLDRSASSIAPPTERRWSDCETPWPLVVKRGFVYGDPVVGLLDSAHRDFRSAFVEAWANPSPEDVTTRRQFQLATNLEARNWRWGMDVQGPALLAYWEEKRLKFHESSSEFHTYTDFTRWYLERSYAHLLLLKQVDLANFACLTCRDFETYLGYAKTELSVYEERSSNEPKDEETPSVDDRVTAIIEKPWTKAAARGDLQLVKKSKDEIVRSAREDGATWVVLNLCAAWLAYPKMLDYFMRLDEQNNFAPRWSSIAHYCLNEYQSRPARQCLSILTAPKVLTRSLSDTYLTEDLRSARRTATLLNEFMDGTKRRRLA